MMDSKLKERFGRLGSIRAIDRLASGSNVAFVLQRSAAPKSFKPVDAALCLAKRGLGMLRAKRTIDGLSEGRRCYIVLPAVEDAERVMQELRSSGVVAAIIEPTETIDVRALRERLHLTREEFALQYGLEVETLRNWEIHKRAPDKAAHSYLRVISGNPGLVAEILAPKPHGAE